MEKRVYDELIELCSDYINTINAIYRLRTFDEYEISKIYKDIKINLLESKIILPTHIFQIISTASRFNCRYYKSYWNIFKKFFEEYHPKQVENLSPVFYYFVYKEYGIILDEKNLILLKLIQFFIRSMFIMNTQSIELL